MTINLSDNNPRVSYAVAEGVTQTSFTVSFEFFDNDDLNVYVDGTLKTITTHYTVSGGSGSTGTVTMSVTGATGGSTVVITRDIDLDRTTDFPSSGPFNIGSLNTELDRMIAITADLEDLASRGVKLADFDTAATLTLPLAADRVNKVLAFNSAGDTLVSQELGVWRGDWAASTAYVERDLVRDSSDGSIYIVTSAHTSSGSTPLDTNTNSSKYSVIFDIGAMIAGTVTMTGDLSVQGNTTLGNAATDTVTITADVASNILPSADNTYDLGGTGAEWKDVYIDGVAYVDSIAMPTTTVTDILDEDTMSSNSATALATQQSIKAYVDSQIGSNNELSEVLGNGNTTGGNNIQLTTTDELQFRDTALKISSSADGQLDIDADTEVEVTSATIDLNVSSELKVTRGIVTVMDFSGTSGDIQFYDDSNNAKILWNASADVLTFEDNVQAYFGGGSAPHLRINHDGTDSFIKNEGTGKLYISSASDDIQLRKGTSEVMAKFTPDGASELYYDNSKKIETTSSGVTVTGTVTADGLTVDATSEISLVSDKTVTTPHTDYNLLLDNGSDTEFVIRLDSVFSGSIGSSHIKQISEGTNRGALVFATESGSGGVVPDRLKIDYNGDISFYEDTGTTAKFFWDASAEALALGTTTSVSNNRLVIEQASGDGQNSGFYMQRNGGTGTSFKLDIDGNDVANFRRSSTTALAIDNSANVGIGTTPSTELHVAASSGYAELRLQGASGSSGSLEFYDSTTKRGDIFIDTSSNILFRNTSEAMRIDSSGNVGVGTSSPQAQVHLQGSGSSSGRLRLNNTNTANYSVLEFRGDSQSFDVGLGNSAATATLQNKFYIYDSTNTTTRLVLDSSGQVGIGTTSPSGLFHAKDSSSSFMFKDVSGNAKIFLDGSNGDFAGGDYMEIEVDSSPNLMFKQAGTERLRIDSSGNLLVGTTDTTIYNDAADEYGFMVEPSGQMQLSANNATMLYLNRQNGDGDIIDFRKDGTTVGSIASRLGVVSTIILDPRSGGAGLTGSGPGAIVPTNNTGASNDGATDLGTSDGRFKDLYLSGGVYLGGTGSANHLDDYEEGTFQSTLTPRTSGTITLLTAYDVLSYTKVGRAVTVTGDLVVSSLSSPVGASIELSLPFTIANLSELSGRVGGAVSYYDASVARTTKPYVGLEGTDYILVTLDPSTLASSDSITFSVTYFTT